MLQEKKNKENARTKLTLWICFMSTSLKGRKEGVSVMFYLCKTRQNYNFQSYRE